MRVLLDQIPTSLLSLLEFHPILHHRLHHLRRPIVVASQCYLPHRRNELLVSSCSFPPRTKNGRMNITLQGYRTGVTQLLRYFIGNLANSFLISLLGLRSPHLTNRLRCDPSAEKSSEIFGLERPSIF